MIAKGTDGLSRGDLDMGVMEGSSMLAFVPLHLGALQRSPPLLDWVHSWCPHLAVQLLTPLEWHTVGHGITDYYANFDGVCRIVRWVPGRSCCGRPHHSH